MRLINKSKEPVSLTIFKSSFPGLNYSELSPGHDGVRIDIRNSCLQEQYYLCAYCCDRITLETSHNEHILPQSSLDGSNKTLDYNNIIASCQATNHCGHKKGDNPIDLTPLMPECESHILYQLNGKVTHYNSAAQSTINSLNLRDGGLSYKRKTIIDILLFDYVGDLVDLSLTSNDELEFLIKELGVPDKDGKLEAFYPIMINVLRQYLK